MVWRNKEKQQQRKKKRHKLRQGKSKGACRDAEMPLDLLSLPPFFLPLTCCLSSRVTSLHDVKTPPTTSHCSSLESILTEVFASDDYTLLPSRFLSVTFTARLFPYIYLCVPSILTGLIGLFKGNNERKNKRQRGVAITRERKVIKRRMWKAKRKTMQWKCKNVRCIFIYKMAKHHEHNKHDILIITFIHDQKIIKDIINHCEESFTFSPSLSYFSTCFY